jgi:hypothetical protein
MNNQIKVNYNEPLKSNLDLEDFDMETIMESDLEDYEIAAGLGMSLGQVFKMRRELFED